MTAATLRRMRDRLAEEIDACDSQANLERMCARLSALLAEIDELDLQSTPSAADQIAQRRQARRPGRAKGRGGAA
jgi:hypothetical protein